MTTERDRRTKAEDEARALVMAELNGRRRAEDNPAAPIPTRTMVLDPYMVTQALEQFEPLNKLHERVDGAFNHSRAAAEHATENEQKIKELIESLAALERRVDNAQDWNERQDVSIGIIRTDLSDHKKEFDSHRSNLGTKIAAAMVVTVTACAAIVKVFF